MTPLRPNLRALAAVMFGNQREDYFQTPKDKRWILVAVCTHFMLEKLKKEGFPVDDLDPAECDAAVLAVLNPPKAADLPEEPLRCARLIGAGGRSAVSALLGRAGCKQRAVKEGPRRRAKGVRHA